MDTIENETPVGSDGATSSPDTASVDTQPAESSDSVSDGIEEDAVEAPLLAGKYKTQEELIKAHQELEHKLGEQGQKAELVNLLEKQTGMNASQIKSYLANQQQEQLMQQYQNNPVPYLANEVQQLKSQIALQTEQQELDKFLSSEEGKPYQPFKEKIFNLGLKLETGKPYADIAREYFGESRAQGQKDAYKKIETKQMTQSSGVKTAPQKSISLDDLRAMSPSERIAAMEVIYKS
jgi:hypothetical protein